MDHPGRNMGHLAGLEHAFLGLHPLLHLALQHVNNFLQLRMGMERMAFPGRQHRPTQLKVLGIGDLRPTQPIVGTPFEILFQGFGSGNETAGG